MDQRRSKTTSSLLSGSPTGDTSSIRPFCAHIHRKVPREAGFRFIIWQSKWMIQPPRGSDRISHWPLISYSSVTGDPRGTQSHHGGRLFAVKERVPSGNCESTIEEPGFSRICGGACLSRYSPVMAFSLGSVVTRVHRGPAYIYTERQMDARTTTQSINLDIRLILMGGSIEVVWASPRMVGAARWRRDGPLYVGLGRGPRL
jgi:hypothetical protein